MRIVERLDQTGIAWVEFDRELAIVAAALLPQTTPSGLSLGDRACLAPARLRDLPAVTADRARASIDPGITVEVLR